MGKQIMICIAYKLIKIIKELSLLLVKMAEKQESVYFKS